MKILLLIFVLFFINESQCYLKKLVHQIKRRSPFYKVNEDALLTTPALLAKNHYPLEIHNVTTEDGYIIQLHRIPYGKSGPRKHRIPVFLMHGMFSASSHWLLAGPEKSLAYILADAGYDVWMGNARGTRYSRKHLKYDADKDSKKFWNFSWHEIGMYDLPASIDYITNLTHHKKIFYVGHSQGTTVFYVMASERPEYNNKILAQFSLAPIAFMKRVKSPYRVLALIQRAFALKNKEELYKHKEYYRKRAAILCDKKSLFYYPCLYYVFMHNGFDWKQTNSSLLPVYLGHSFEGSAFKQLLHYGQSTKTGKFRQYDLGVKGNVKHYHNLKPPSYHLNKITSPVYLYHSKNDWVSQQGDVKLLHKKIKNSTTYLIPYDKFNHIDFLIAIDAPELVYKPLLADMEYYKNRTINTDSETPLKDMKKKKKEKNKKDKKYLKDMKNKKKEKHKKDKKYLKDMENKKEEKDKEDKKYLKDIENKKEEKDKKDKKDLKDMENKKKEKDEKDKKKGMKETRK